MKGLRKYRNVPTVIDGIRITDRDLQRFWSKVEVRDDGDCWEWKAGAYRHGYGQFSIGGAKSARKIGAHRFSLAVECGAHDSRLHVLHSCDNPKCVNPSHLRFGSQRENRQDSKERGRNAVGEKNGAAKLSDKAVAEIRRRNKIGDLQKDIAATFNVSRSLIGYICQGKVWRHVE